MLKLIDMEDDGTPDSIVVDEVNNSDVLSSDVVGPDVARTCSVMVSIVTASVVDWVGNVISESAVVVTL